MRKIVVLAALAALIILPACTSTSASGVEERGGLRTVYGWIWEGPRWITKNIFGGWVDNGHYDGRARWDNFLRNAQKIENFADIHFFNYDIRDPYAATPFYGDPR